MVDQSKQRNDLSDEDLKAFIDQLSEAARCHLVEKGYTGKEFVASKSKKSNKYFLSLGLNDSTYNAEFDKFATIDFTLKTKFRIYLKSSVARCIDADLSGNNDKNVVLDFDNFGEFQEIAKKAIISDLEIYEPSWTFGCCSKYEQCSNAGKCIHDFKLYAKGCQYRKNLENSLIFYGENANV